MGSLILGTLLVVASVFGLTYWWWDVLDILRGIIPILLLVLGIIAIGAGLDIVKNEPVKNKFAKKRKENINIGEDEDEE